MRAKLSEEDIKNLKYQCRAGYVVSILFFLTGSSIIFVLYYINDINSLPKAVLLFLTILTISFLIAFFMMNKYITDINNKVKILDVKKIQAKELKKAYEAGSGGRLSFDGNMKAFNRYDIISDNTRYRINKAFFEACREGDEVIFHIAPKSKHRLKIVLNKDTKYEDLIY